jgi:hypothetical protein
MLSLIYIKWSEGRVTFFGHGSKAYHRMQSRRIQRETQPDIKAPATSSDIVVTPRSESDYSSQDGKHSDTEDHTSTAHVLGRGARLDSDSSEDKVDLKA